MNKYAEYKVGRILANGEEMMVLSTGNYEEAQECYYDEITEMEGQLASGFNKKVPYSIIKVFLKGYKEAGHRDILKSHHFEY